MNVCLKARDSCPISRKNRARRVPLSQANRSMLILLVGRFST